MWAAPEKKPSIFSILIVIQCGVFVEYAICNLPTFSDAGFQDDGWNDCSVNKCTQTQSQYLYEEKINLKLGLYSERDSSVNQHRI